MKCEVCLELLEEYLDGELPAADQEQIRGHLITCAACAASFTTLTAEQELFSRYDREVEVPPFLWTRIAQHTVSENTSKRPGWAEQLASVLATGPFVTAFAIVVFAFVVLVGLENIDWNRVLKGDSVEVDNRTKPAPKQQDQNDRTANRNEDRGQKQNQQFVAAKPRPKRKASPAARVSSDQSDVLVSNLGFDLDDRDTAKHIEQTEIFLRSIRNVQVSDGDEEVDVSYDKALSRRLLNENVVLRRDAEMKAKFPTKSLLADVEPILIDIANLPDHARAEDMRAIKDRMQKTEIVAALMGYQDRGPNNR